MPTGVHHEEERLAALAADSVLALDGRLLLEEDERGPLVRLEGVNLQLVDGGGSGNVASGEAATVSGGRLRTAGSAYAWVAGGLRQDQ